MIQYLTDQKGQPNQLRYASEGRVAPQGGSEPLYDGSTGSGLY